MGDGAMRTHLETEHGDAVFQEPLLLRCVLVRLGAKLPTYATDGSAGMDLYAAHDASVYALRPCSIDTGVVLEIPAGYEGQVRPRSGMARKQGLATYLGTCDSDYRGSIGVTLLWSVDVTAYPAPIKIKAGDRIAQLVIMPVPRVELVEAESVEQLSSTSRGASGFGSSGK